MWSSNGMLFKLTCGIALSCALSANRAGRASDCDPTPQRASLSNADEQANGTSGFERLAISGDGRVVAFWSVATNLYPGASDGTGHVIARETWFHKTLLANIGTNDLPQGSGNIWSNGIAISDNGNMVAFLSANPNLVPNDTNGNTDVFVHDFYTGETTRASVSNQTAPFGTFGGAFDVDLSPDGRYVAFRSNFSDLVPNDTNNQFDIFVYDREFNFTTRVSVDSAGAQANLGSNSPSISEKCIVAFVSSASNLVAGDTNNVGDIFAHHCLFEETIRVSVSSAGVQANNSSFGPAITPDGRYVVFFSDASNLVPGDTNNVRDVFVHDIDTSQTTRVSVTSAGGQANAHCEYPSISDDGRYVVFHSSASSLVSGDNNGVRDIFKHDRQTGQTTRVSVTGAGAQANGQSRFGAISGDGQVVAFESSAANLVPDDTNGLTDVIVRPLCPPLADTDGDGLPDEWEKIGIPYTDSKGDEQRYFLVPPANFEHKDIYVEVDSMQGLSLSDEAADMVVDAFANAPVPNPDGTLGISLHILPDDSTIPFDSVTPTPAQSWPANAPALRQGWFGTAAERADASAQALLAAKAKAFRYCIVMNRSSENIGVLAEQSGDDLLVFVTYSDGTPHPAIHRAASFMHGLGHTLGLKHGGGDDIEGKPNYPSIMNYPLIYRDSWNQAFWQLDYSRQKLRTLHESNLNELAPVGSSQYFDFYLPFYNIVPDGSPCFFEAKYGLPVVSYLSLHPTPLIDYNLDCDYVDAGLAVDLNYYAGSGLPGSANPSPGEVLRSFDDWTNSQIAVLDGGGPFAGPVFFEITEEVREWMANHFPVECIADIAPAPGGDDVVNVNDLLAVINAWGTADPNADVNNDGIVNVNDLLAVINSWGPCI